MLAVKKPNLRSFTKLLRDGEDIIHDSYVGKAVWNISTSCMN